MRDPAVLFYSGDFLNGCSDLTMEERGQYITMLCLQHQKGHLSEKTIRLSVGSVSIDVMKKFTKDDDGNYFNLRMEAESEKRRNFTESRRNNGNLGGRPNKSKPIGKPKDNHMDNHMHNHMGNENINENIDINKSKDDNEIIIESSDFLFFWNEYDKKVDKDKCKKKWEKLSESDKNKIFIHLPLYKKATPDKKYRKNPETYLNNKSWNDEIIDNTKKPNFQNGTPKSERVNPFLAEYFDLVNSGKTTHEEPNH